MTEPVDLDSEDYNDGNYPFIARWDDEDEHRDRAEEAYNDYLMHGGDQ